MSGELSDHETLMGRFMRRSFMGRFQRRMEQPVLSCRLSS